MNLFENPIFLTHKRLVHRRGVLAAIIIAAVIGVSLLAGMIAYLGTPRDFHFSSRQEAGESFYGWTIGIEILVLVIGGFAGISRALADDRKTGLWESNRLTPLRPGQIVAGYWFGPALREFYMAVVLAAFGLFFVVLGHLPLTLWLGTQTLIVSTALFFGLLAVLCGMAFKGSQGMLMLLACFLVFPFSEMATSRILMNFLLPLYGIINLFPGDDQNDPWRGPAHIFAFSVYPVLLTLILQLIIGIFIWRALVRKTANPFQPLLIRWEAVALFIIIIAAQHGLLWNLWNGRFPTPVKNYPPFGDIQLLPAIVHCGTILIAAALLAAVSPAPEQVRVESLRLGFRNFGAIISRSAVSLALVLAIVAGASISTQCAHSLASSYQIILVVSINLLEIFIVFALLLEFCRLRHQRRAPGFIALWIFSLGVIPLILAGVFSDHTWAELSLLAPGFTALNPPDDVSWPCLFYILLAHFGVVVLFFIAWRREWKKLLEKARQ